MGAAVCVMALILLLCAVAEFNSAMADRKENNRVLDLFSSRTEEYEALGNRLSQTDSYEKQNAEIEKLRETYDSMRSAHQLALATYTATRGGLKQGREAMDQATGMMSASSIIGSVTAAAQNAIAGLYTNIYDFQDSVFNAYANVDVMISEGRIEDAMEYMAVIEQQVSDYAAYMQESANQSSGGGMDLGSILSGVNTLAGAFDAINAGKEELERMELQAVKDSIDLSLTKAELDKREQEIRELTAAADVTKADERRQISLGVNLKANEHVKAATDNGMAILTAAKQEADRMRKENRNSFLLQLGLMCLLLAAGIAGFLCLPAAFERVSDRGRLIAPAVCFTVLSAGGDALSYFISGSQHYGAMMGAIIGILYMLCAFPQDKLLADEDFD